ncbi:MAG: excinuclease ABC subunit UvrC [candidate division Zixibacteria bacterium]|nr:excinuclease ABC subunit UvrC [candidate division Zixibacteria bacterium]MDD5425884.1 excinuclease ABC subunit UvrC [candidate division Zixibacteria bacterium]
MTKASKNLALKLQNLPASPGVYMFKNAQGKIIYIGKAKNLRNRVRSYFQDGNRHDLKTFRLVSKIADLELLVTENEVESLILEANLVREHKPRYNVMLRDDKHFPYIKITTGEPFPRVLIVRRLEKDKAVYFGPYTSSLNMRKTVTFLTRLFKIRTCNYIIPPPEGKKYQVCLDYHIDRCKGPCEGLQSEEDYREQVNAVMMILSGKSKKLLGRLSEKMFAASEAMRFEEARLYRDQIDAIKAVVVKQSADVGEVIDRDIVSIAREARDAVAVIMQIREGVLIGRQDFQLLADENDSEEAVLEAFLIQYYNHQPNLPEEIFIPMELAEVAVIENWLKAVKGSAIKIVTPRIGSKVKLVDLAAKNARLLLDELLIQKQGHQERTSKMVTALKDELHLSVSPKTMVCFDISNTGETDAVGACVYFENGKPRKNEYRHFKIKGVTGQDDFTMMREVVGRYFYRLQSEKLSPPDLVVVDGGKGQLSSALAELKSLGFDNQPVIALAKRLEEVYLPVQSDPITISKSSPALILLKRIRDEAHRFAINYNRKVRSRRTIQSALDSVPGIGPAKRALLLQSFGSVERIKKATLEELTAVKGINEKLARTILENLNKL